MFLTSCEAVSLAWQEGFASVKMPSTALEKAHLRPGTRIRMLHPITPGVISCYAPHILVVDTVPSGSMLELLPILNWPIRRVFIYREQQEQMVREADFQRLLARYHRVIVPHDESADGFPMPPETRAEYVGHMLLRSRDETLSRDEARDRLGLPRDRVLIYVGFGGGGDPKHSSASVWVLEQAAGFPEFHFACPRAPLEQADLATPKMPNVSCFRYWPLAECWSAFDGAISAVGYNTAGELLHHGVSTIWIPLEKKRDDQHLRAQRAVDRGAGWLVRQNDTAALRAALAELANPERRRAVAHCSRQIFPVNGAERAADSLLKWIEST